MRMHEASQIGLDVYFDMKSLSDFGCDGIQGIQEQTKELSQEHHQPGTGTGFSTSIVITKYRHHLKTKYQLAPRSSISLGYLNCFATRFPIPIGYTSYPPLRSITTTAENAARGSSARVPDRWILKSYSILTSELYHAVGLFLNPKPMKAEQKCSIRDIGGLIRARGDSAASTSEPKPNSYSILTSNNLPHCRVFFKTHPMKAMRICSIGSGPDGGLSCNVFLVSLHICTAP